MNFPTVKLIRDAGIVPQKKLGQNFLVDRDVAGRIVDAADISESDFVIEIGAGMGALTYYLSKTGAEIVCFEIDRTLFAFLTEAASKHEKLTILNADFLQHDFPGLIPQGRKCLMTGSIPYAVTKEILFAVLKDLNCISKALFVVQKEVAGKMIARAGSKQYSALSVLFHAYTKTQLHFVVPADRFYPMPKVDSALVEIQSTGVRRWADENEVFFRTVVKESFSQRRKKLYNNLKRFLIQKRVPLDLFKAQALKQKIDLDKRAEQLSVEDFYNISDIIGKLSSNARESVK